MRRRAFAGGSPLPGFELALGFTLFYLVWVVLAPISALLFQTARLDWSTIAEAVLAPRTLAAYRLSLTAALAAAAVNAVFGLLLAWVLERCPFPGRRLVDGLVDLPFALPTAVAGIALTSLYAANGWIGSWLEPWGIKVAYTRLGIVVALIFVGLPFVVRAVQPVLRDLDAEVEDAAASLGASRVQIFARVVLPQLAPAVGTGFLLAFARALGEYGSVIFIAGNLPLSTEITPLLIMIELEQYDVAGATAIATVFLAISFAILLAVHKLSSRGFTARARALRT